MLNGRQWPVLDGHGLGNGGERGIRTLGTLTRTTVFETAPFDHSGISPWKAQTGCPSDVGQDTSRSALALQDIALLNPVNPL